MMKRILSVFAVVFLLMFSCDTEDPFVFSSGDQGKNKKVEAPDTSTMQIDKSVLLGISSKNKAIRDLDWSSEKDVYSWKGIGVKDNRVVSVDLSGIDLQQIPKELIGLTALESLYLKNTNLTGEVPAFLGAFRKLRLLNVTGNELTTVSSALGNSKIRILLLKDNKLKTLPEEIGDLDLLVFSIENNDIKGALPKKICDAFDFNNPSFSKDEWVHCGE